MIVVDIEASGTDPNKHSILSIGAIDFEAPKREFYGECRMWDGAHIMDEALLVNGFSREETSDPEKPSESELIKKFLSWVLQSADNTMAGQNPQFDVGFIQSACARAEIDFPLAHRLVDLHSVCYFHMIQRGIKVPMEKGRTALNSDKIMTYVGIPKEPRPHIASNGAHYETEAFSRLFREKPFFEEFEKYKIPWL